MLFKKTIKIALIDWLLTTVSSTFSLFFMSSDCIYHIKLAAIKCSSMQVWGHAEHDMPMS